MDTIYDIVNNPDKAYVYDVLKDAQLPTVVLEVPFFIRHNDAVAKRISDVLPRSKTNGGWKGFILHEKCR